MESEGQEDGREMGVWAQQPYQGQQGADCVVCMRAALMAPGLCPWNRLASARCTRPRSWGGGTVGASPRCQAVPLHAGGREGACTPCWPLTCRGGRWPQPTRPMPVCAEQGWLWACWRRGDGAAWRLGSRKQPPRSGRWAVSSHGTGARGDHSLVSLIGPAFYPVCLRQGPPHP